MRIAGIVLVSVAAAHIVAGVIAIAADPVWRPPPPMYGSVMGTGAVISIAGGVTAGTGLLVYGIPGAALWIAGNNRMTSAAASLGRTGLSIGPGPAGAQGLSLRWRF
jgi:hypothetical protein